MFGNWLFGSTVIVVLFMVFYFCFKQERYVCISVPSHHNLGSPPPPFKNSNIQSYTCQESRFYITGNTFHKVCIAYLWTLWDSFLRGDNSWSGKALHMHIHWIPFHQRRLTLESGHAFVGNEQETDLRSLVCKFVEQILLSGLQTDIFITIMFLSLCGFGDKELQQPTQGLAH